MLRRTLSAPLFALLLAALACGALPASAAPVKTPHVEAELVSERTALVPGAATTVALRLQMADGWHTYWQNPGDSGLPTTLAWKLPEGVTAGDDPVARAPRAAGRTARQLRLRGRGPPPGRRAGARHGAHRRAAHAQGQGRMARLPRDLHPRGGGPRARASGVRSRRSVSAVGPGDRRHARCAAAQGCRAGWPTPRARARRSR